MHMLRLAKYKNDYTNKEFQLQVALKTLYVVSLGYLRYIHMRHVLTVT
jgi:hypothetical protein